MLWKLIAPSLSAFGFAEFGLLLLFSSFFYAVWCIIIKNKKIKIERVQSSNERTGERGKRKGEKKTKKKLL